jgi:Flp pilus assembly protein TadD/uncharacterized membrane protein
MTSSPQPPGAGATAPPETQKSHHRRPRPGIFSARPAAAILRLSILALAVALLYQNTLHGPFVFDDFRHISENPHMRMNRLSVAELVEAGFQSPNPRRAVANISFAINHFIHGDTTFGYHLVNLLLHLATGIVLYFFTTTTLELATVRKEDLPVKAIAFFAALIWIVHPVQTQPVNYIVQRMTVMAAFFYLCALLSYAKARTAEHPMQRRYLFVAAGVAGILAIGSKEIALSLPFFIGLYEWYFFQDLRRTWLKKRAFYIVLLLALLISALLLITQSHSRVIQFLLKGWSEHEFTLSERLLSQFRVVVYYISLLLWPNPQRLHLDYDFAPSHSIVSPLTTLPAVMLVAGLLVLAVVRAPKNRVLSFAILWFLGNLVIESSILPLALVYEHRLYLPSMFVCVAGTVAAYHWIAARRISGVLLCLVAVLFSYWTVQRNTVWQDAVSIWKDNVSKAPQKARGYHNLGRAYAVEGQFAEAIHNYHATLIIDPEHPGAFYGLGVVMRRQNRYEEAEVYLRKAIELIPNDPTVYNEMGVVLMQQKKLEAAVAHLFTAVELEPLYETAHNNLGVALARQGRLPEAFRHLQTALNLDPEYADAYSNVGLLLLSTGQNRKAALFFRKALQFDPQHDRARKNLKKLEAHRPPAAKTSL